MFEKIIKEKKPLSYEFSMYLKVFFDVWREKKYFECL